jgi:hypothetical protein
LVGPGVNVRLGNGLPLAERADEAVRLGAVEHYRGLPVFVGAEPDERRLPGGTDVRAVQVRVEDERRPEFRRERGEAAARLRAFLERARVVAEEKIDLAAAGNALEGGALGSGGAVPAASGSRRPGAKRAAVGETAQAAEPKACSGRHVVHAVAEGHRAGCGGAFSGAGERLRVVVVSFYEQKLEACSAEQSTGGAEEAAPFLVARQVAEVAEAKQRVAVLLDRAAQVVTVGVQVAEDEQTAHLS